MLQILETILHPIVLVMGWVLSGAANLTSSKGLAIILLSLVVFIAVRPLRRMARRVQQKEIDVQEKMAEPLREAKARYKGEERFNAIERIYQQFDYHPIKSLRSTLVFVVQIPFLLSALFLLINDPGMQGVPFLFIRDLGQSDGLLPLPFGGVSGVTSINLLPIALLGITLLESFTTQAGSVAMKLRANIIGFVIFVIVYPLASALVLYWTCNNLWSLLTALVVEQRQKADVPARGAQ